MALNSIYRSYAVIIKVLGVEASIANFIRGLNLPLANPAKLLEIGCGTGIIGLTLLEGRPQAQLLSTDLNYELLARTQQNAKQKGISSQQLQLGIADVSQPQHVTLLEPEGQTLELPAQAFDLVITGGVLGYASNIEQSLTQLLALVKPGGYYLNIEMHQGWVSRWVAKRYHYPIVELSSMQTAAKRFGFKIDSIPIKTFPARLTRICYLLSKE